MVSEGRKRSVLCLSCTLFALLRGAQAFVTPRAISRRSNQGVYPIQSRFVSKIKLKEISFSRNGALYPGWTGSTGLTSLAKVLFRNDGHVPFGLALGLNVVLFAALQSKLSTMLTPAGYYHSMALGTILWTTLGWRGWSYCVLYLFLGQLVTKIGFADKEKRGLSEKRGGRRGPENVWGSAATSALCAIFASQGKSFLGINSSLYRLAFVAALATKLADTFASEIGKAYGKTTFLITTLQRVQPGTEGAISAEGTAAAVVGGFLLSLYGYSIGLIDGLLPVAICTLSAFVATNVESILGATLQEKKGLQWMTNEVVNFLNTLIGGFVAALFGKLFLAL